MRGTVSRLPLTILEVSTLRCGAAKVAPAFALPKMDLSLVPIDELVKEIESRSACFIAAVQLPEDKKRNSDLKFWYGKGNWLESVALAGILQNDVLNNWSGELRTLQRINEDKDGF